MHRIKKEGGFFMKRLICFALAIVLILSLVMTGCGNKEDSQANKDSSKSADSQGGKANESKKNEIGGEKVKVTKPGTFPIVEESTTLNIMVTDNVSVEDFATNEFTKWYEEKTKVHIDWSILPANGADEKLNLVLAGQDYPDVFMDCPIDTTQVMNYGKQGIFIPLNDYIEKYGVEVKKLFNDMEYVKNLLTFPDGKIYSMPYVNQCYHCSMAQKMWIYKPWLEKLNLDMPTTTDDFYEVLKVFHDKDPNGNGKKDEVPLAGANNGWFSEIDGFLMCPFVYNDGRNRMIIKDGNLDVTFNKPEWKEGLKYMHKLYKEGLMAPESFTQDADQLKQMGENPDTVVLGAAPGGHTGVFTQFYGESGRWLEYEAIPPLKGPNGYSSCYYNPFGVGVTSFIVTKKCEIPEVAVRWADGMYDRETTLRSVFGRLDEEWGWAGDEEIGINGKKAIYKTLKPWTEGVQNVCWMQSGPSLRTNELRLGEVANPDEPLETILYKETNEKYDPHKPNINSIVPPLAFTEEQANEIADFKKTINDYVNEMLARFVTGDADIDKDWDSYLKELENMNLKRYIDLSQEAYDAKYKK